MQNNPPKENPFLNLFINILLPVLILNKGGKYFEPQLVLMIALSLPLIYGIQDYVRRGHKNYVSLIGLVNIALTGGLALMSLHGIWFAVKEASLPALLGLMVFFSTWTKNPAAKMVFCNPQVLNLELIDQKLRELGREGRFQELLKRTTLWFSLSFLISAILNFILAFRIFSDIDPALEVAVREELLNQQIAKMTWAGFAVIAAPLMIFSGVLVYFFIKRISEITETPMQALLKS